MSHHPLISIITVVYNGAETVENTFQSISKQSFQDFEYIVVDGGSTDNTVEIIKQNASIITRWISEPDNGIYDAMNKAIKLSKGRYLCFLGADDVLNNNLDKIATYLIDIKTVYYGNVFRPNINRKYDGKFTAYKLACRNICHQSIFYPKQILEKHDYNLKYPLFADYELNLRCYSDPEINLQYIPVTVAIFNDRGGTSSSRIDVDFEKDRLPLIRKHFSSIVFIMAALRFSLIKLLIILKLHKLFLKINHFIVRNLSKIY